MISSRMVIENLTTVLGSIPASSYAVESDGRQMKQCWIKCTKKPKKSRYEKSLIRLFWQDWSRGLLREARPPDDCGHPDSEVPLSSGRPRHAYRWAEDTHTLKGQCLANFRKNQNGAYGIKRGIWEKIIFWEKKPLVKISWSCLFNCVIFLMNCMYVINLWFLFLSYPPEHLNV
jgi:hypothetical protein